MLDRDPRRLAAWAGAILVLLVLTAWYLSHSRSSGGAAPPPVATIAVRGEGGDGGGKVAVDVAGEVDRPGVYLLPAGARVEDALERAGGPTRKADLTQLNRAAKLEDGRQVLVPPRAGRAQAAAAAGSAGSAPGGAEQPINLNTATLEQLDTLDGVGPSTAQKILDYRTEHGGFTSIDELDQIPGIGEKRLAALRERVQL